MKNQITIQGFLLIILFAFVIFFEACKEDPPPCPTVDYTTIEQSIDSAQKLHDNAVEGTDPGEYPSPSKGDLQQAIDVAKSVHTKNCVTQQELNTAVSTLNTAIANFESKKIPDCPDVDYTEIDAAIANAQQMHDNAVEGTQPGEYQAGAKGELQESINQTQTTRDTDCVSQQELDDAAVALDSALIIFESKKIPDCPDVDYTEIDVAIANAQQIYDNAVEGTEPGEYPPGAKVELQLAIDQAQSVRDTECISQQELDYAVVALNNALEVFESKIIPDLSVNLVAHWLFNGDGSDASGNGHNGIASAGHANWGGGMPELASDRFGNPNYCYKFVDGGNFVVENGPDFIPAELTISVWMNLYDTWPHSYFFSNDIWNTFKFQIQDANKPFFTAHYMKSDQTEGWIDKDSNTGILQLDRWYQVVLTYKGGEMTFYIDGVKVQYWDDFDAGTLIPPNPAVDICIGQALPTDIYSSIPDDPYEWKEWLGYFKGYIDDMRFYNVVLTETQVKSLYDYEKTTTVE